MFYRTSTFTIGDEGNNLILERKMKKILSIDGGGIRGIIPAMVLAEIERITEVPTAENFDLIAGTSTGGILALGLSRPDDEGNARYSAADLVDIYRDRGREIFNRSFWKGLTSVGGLTDETYSATGLEEILAGCFREVLLGDALTNTMVTSYDIEEREPIFLRSWRPEYAEVRMRDAARATSAAPTFFEPAQVRFGDQTRTLVDGGVFINTPSVSAYAAANRMIAEERANAERRGEDYADPELFVLSLGTGELTRRIPYQDARNWGKLEWALPIISCIFDGVSDAAHYQMRSFLGDERYVRLQIRLEGADDDMDNASSGNIRNLMALARELIANTDMDRILERLQG